MPSSTTPGARKFLCCLDPGPLRPFVDQFTGYLAGLGHTALTVRGYDDAARHFAAWLQQAGISLDAVDNNTLVGFANHKCQCPGIRRDRRISGKYARRASRFVRFLGVRRGQRANAAAARSC